MSEVFKIDETGFLLKDPEGDFLVFMGTLVDLKAYQKWYKRNNRGDELSVEDHNVFIVTREVGNDET